MFFVRSNYRLADRVRITGLILVCLKTEFRGNTNVTGMWAVLQYYSSAQDSETICFRESFLTSTGSSIIL